MTELVEFLKDNQSLMTFESGPFRTSSGVILDRFYSIWPIIDDVNKFEEFAEVVADEMSSICSQLRANMVVGCSRTIQNTFEGVRPYISEKIELRYLGTHPLQYEYRSLRKGIRGRKVIVLTDVLASGTMLRETIRLLKSHGAQVQGSLAFLHAASNDDQRSFLDERVKAISEFHDHAGTVRRPDDTENSVPVIPCKTYLTIPTGSSINSKENPTEIDVEAVFPIGRASTQNGAQDFTEDGAYNPIIGPIEEVTKRNSSILVSGQYEKNSKLFSIYVDIDLLISEFSKELVSSFHSILDGLGGQSVPLVVTTPTTENRTLIRYLADNSPEHKIRSKLLLFFRTDDLEASFPYTLIDETENIEDRDIVIVLSTVQSSDTIRALSAHLSLSGARSISILAVIDRMTIASSVFLARVLRLYSIEKSIDDPGVGDFNYKTLFRVWDLSSGDLQRVQQFIKNRFRQFTKSNTSAELATTARNNLKYFETADLDAPKNEFSFFISSKLEPRQSANEHQIAKGLRELVQDGSLSTLIGLLAEPTLTKQQYFSCLKLIAADMPRLSQGCNLNQLATVLTSSLSPLIEEHPGDKVFDLSASLAPVVEREARQLVSVGLFSDILLSPEMSDSPTDLEIRVKQIIDEIWQNPEHSVTYLRLHSREWCFGFAFTISQLISTEEFKPYREKLADILTYIQDDIDFAIQGRKKSKKKGVYDVVDQLVLYDAVGGQSESDRDAKRRATLSQLLHGVTSLQEILGERNEVSLGMALRSIRRQVYWHRPKHADIGRTLKDYSNEIVAWAFDNDLEEQWTIDLAGTPDSFRMLRCVTELQVVVAKLREIARLTRALLRESMHRKEWTGIFLGRTGENIDTVLSNLDTALDGIRVAHNVSQVDVEVLRDSSAWLLTKLYGEPRLNINENNTSGFFDYIAEHEVDVLDLIEDQISIAKRRLSENFRSDKEPKIQVNLGTDLKGKKARRAYTLLRVDVLKGVLENCLSNFRHAKGAEKAVRQGRRIGAVSILITGADDRAEFNREGANDFVSIEFSSASSDDAEFELAEDTTLEAQRQVLREYGGTMEFYDSEHEFKVTIKVPRITKPVVHTQ